jgi:hypothetical protein
VGSWFLAIGWVDAVAGTCFCSVNNNTPASQALTGVITSGAAPFLLGDRFNGAGEHFDGYLDKIGYWITAPGAGGVLTPTQRTALYGAGTPPNYPFTGIP